MNGTSTPSAIETAHGWLTRHRSVFPEYYVCARSQLDGSYQHLSQIARNQLPFCTSSALIMALFPVKKGVQNITLVAEIRGETVSQGIHHVQG